MSNKEILEKAVKLALQNGMDHYGYPDNGWGTDYGQWSTSNYHLCMTSKKRGDEYTPYRDIIFNHQFAIAIWGEEIEKKI